MEIKKNNVAFYLKIGSVLIFSLAVVGLMIISEKEKIITTESDSYFAEDAYKTAREFDISFFLGGVFITGIGSSLLYSFGELIELQNENNQIIKQLIVAKKDD